jgi:hypothetical protein
VTGHTIPWTDEVQAADWLVEELSDDLGSTGWLVPKRFAAVARLTHSDPAALGTLPAAADATILIGVLGRFTSTPDRCWFGVSTEFGWNGLDPVGGPVFASDAHTPGPDAAGSGPEPEAQTVYRRGYDKALVRAPHRSFMLYPGPLDAAWLLVQQAGWDHLPNLWWPDDRTWCVRTDIDDHATLVGGPAELIDALEDEPGLRVSRADND